MLKNEENYFVIIRTGNAIVFLGCKKIVFPQDAEKK